jgi:hypothetical protein
MAAADHHFGTDGVLMQDIVREHPLNPVFAPWITGEARGSRFVYR